MKFNEIKHLDFLRRPRLGKAVGLRGKRIGGDKSSLGSEKKAVPGWRRLTQIHKPVRVQVQGWQLSA